MYSETMKNSIEREFVYEIEEYKVNKRILNMLCDMGYIIKDWRKGASAGVRMQSLVKKTNKHLIVINFDYRRRIVLGPEEQSKKLLNDQNDLIDKFKPMPFSKWLRNHNMLPPDFDLPEYDEENM